MKKTRNKIFITIISILSIILIGILIFTNIWNYNIQYDNIRTIINQMEKLSNKAQDDIRESTYRDDNNSKANINDKDNNEFKDNIPDNEELNDNRNIFVGAYAYTVLLDENGEYRAIINHTDNTYFNEAKIKKQANKILKSKKKTSISNLYFSNYCYTFPNDTSLVIIDITKVREDLINLFLKSILIFIVAEIVIIILTLYLTKWIMKPVISAFTKQKQFISDASHELKTPIAVIMASLDAYSNDGNDKWIKITEKELERMSKLTINLLDLARVEENTSLELKLENISEVIESEILTMESLFYENDINLDYKIDKDIMYKCNKLEISELVNILLDNALNHCNKKGKIEIVLTNIKNSIIFSVTNTGSIIKEEEYDKIFERFYKSDTSRNRNNNRYGLGLAIAKNIVIRNNGKISVSSSNNKTTFKVVFSKRK